MERHIQQQQQQQPKKKYDQQHNWQTQHSEELAEAGIKKWNKREKKTNTFKLMKTKKKEHIQHSH